VHVHVHVYNLISRNYHTIFLSLQKLCTECGQKLSDAELKMVKQEPVAKKMAILEQQYEALQVRNLADPQNSVYRYTCTCTLYHNIYYPPRHSQLPMFQYLYNIES
jgi:hypothetical protein